MTLSKLFTKNALLQGAKVHLTYVLPQRSCLYLYRSEIRFLLLKAAKNRVKQIIEIAVQSNVGESGFAATCFFSDDRV